MKKETIYKIFKNIPSLETERLVLRKISLDDTDDMYEYSKNKDVTTFLSWSPHPDKAYTLDYLRYLQCRYKTGDFFDWAITLKGSGKMIGTCGFTRFNYLHDSAEIGYVLNPEYWGKGIATEASACVIKFGFEQLPIYRIESKFIIENQASRKVMEKNGMIFEGVRRGGMLIKGRYCDIGICSILREEFLKNL